MKAISTWFSTHSKFVTAIVGAVILISGRHFGLNSEAYTDEVVIATALGVYGIPNTP